MKKSLINIIILALVITNLVLTAVIVFAVVPNMNNSNKLVRKVALALDLELVEKDKDKPIPIDDIEVYDIYSVEKKFTTSLKSEDNTSHYIAMSVSLKLNTKHEDYKKYIGSIESKMSLIRSEISGVIQSKTRKQMQENSEAVAQEILGKLQTLYESEFIIDVVFGDMALQ